MLNNFLISQEIQTLFLWESVLKNVGNSGEISGPGILKHMTLYLGARILTNYNDSVQTLGPNLAILPCIEGSLGG